MYVKKLLQDVDAFHGAWRRLEAAKARWATPATPAPWGKEFGPPGSLSRPSYQAVYHRLMLVFVLSNHVKVGPHTAWALRFIESWDRPGGYGNERLATDEYGVLADALTILLAAMDDDRDERWNPSSASTLKATNGPAREVNRNDAASQIALLQAVGALPTELSVKQAAPILRVHKDTVIGYIEDGQLESRDAAPRSSSKRLLRVTLRSVIQLRTSYTRAQPTESTPVPARQSKPVRPRAAGETRPYKHLDLGDGG